MADWRRWVAAVAGGAGGWLPAAGAARLRSELVPQPLELRKRLAELPLGLFAGASFFLRAAAPFFGADLQIIDDFFESADELLRVGQPGVPMEKTKPLAEHGQLEAQHR